MASVMADSCAAQTKMAASKEEYDRNCNGQTESVQCLQVSASEGVNADHDIVALMYKDSPNVSSSDMKKLEMTNLDNNKVEVATEENRCTVFDSGPQTQSGGTYEQEERREAEEPLSLSKTSSLLREVQELGEDRDLCLPTSMTSTEVEQQVLEPGKMQKEDHEEAITYHVLDNSTIIKFEAPSRQGGMRDEVNSEETEAFDGHTITLVEDENNAGTFKIAEIGEDNTLRVIDNDRIVVFQDESAMNAMCKEEDNGEEKVEGGDGEVASSCINQSMNTGQSDNINIPEVYTATDAMSNQNMSLFKEDRLHTNKDSSQPYLQKDRASEGVEAVQTYADTSIMKPLHTESAAHSAQHHQRNGAAFSAPNTSVPYGHSWHYPTERDPPHPPHHYKTNETSFQSHPSSSGTVPVPCHQQTSTDYGRTSSSSSATSHGSYSEVKAAYPGYGPHQMTNWVATSGNVAGGQGEVMSSVAEGGGSKIGDGYGQSGGHDAAVYGAAPPPFMPVAASSYVGYTGDVCRPRRAGKASEGREMYAGTQEGMLYPPQHTHHHHAPHHPPVRPYPTYPLWEAPPTHPSQCHLHYMPANLRGRNPSRIHRTRLNTAVQNSQTPINISNMASRCSAPVAINSVAVGRPRKRSASQMDACPTSKTSLQEGSSTLFPSSKEPARKRGREQQAVSITNLGTLASNVHTLKPGHIIAWYIDYLIHENEDRTQISRAFTLPVNLFHTDDFYFLDSLRKKIRFPSPKFLTWMQYHLPSLNAHAIDFREGRPSREASVTSSSVSQWSQDWGWQNKSKRDIIHDVFFYFQHRKAANTETHQYVCAGSRPKAQLVA